MEPRDDDDDIGSATIQSLFRARKEANEPKQSSQSPRPSYPLNIGKRQMQSKLKRPKAYFESSPLNSSRSNLARQESAAQSRKKNREKKYDKLTKLLNQHGNVEPGTIPDEVAEIKRKQTYFKKRRKEEEQRKRKAKAKKREMQILEMEQMAKKEKDRQEKFDRIERERAIAEKGRVEKFRKEHLRRKLADEQKRIDASKFVRNIRERSGVPLYKRKQEEWRLKENNELIQNNKKVMKRKERMQPLNHGDLDKFEKTYLRRKRQVKQLNYEYQRFVEENSPQKRRSRKPVFEREVMRTEDEKRRKQLENLKKKKQYSDIVRENFLPIPNIKKHKELVERRKKIRTLPKKPLRKAPDYLRGLKDRKDNIVRRTNIKRTIDSARNLIRQIDSERSHRPAKDTSKKRLVSSESEIYRQRRSARRRQEEERKKQASVKEKRRKRGKRISPLKKRLLHNNCAEDQTKKEAKVTVRASSEVNLKSPVQKPSTKVGKNEEEILERIHYLKSLDTDHAEISDCYINLIKTRLEKLKRTTMD